jgi:hypothetical protein
MTWIAILSIGLVAGTLGGIVGFGSSLILLPILVYAFGSKDAVPIMAIAGLLANVSRVAVWWRDVDWRACLVYSLPAVPAAALGARTLVALDARTVEMVIGAFFILMVPVRRWLLARGWRIGLGSLALVGAGIGFLTGMVASTGPVNTPFFLAYGLTRGAFLSTEALGSIAIQVTKAAVFRTFGALPAETILRGLVVGASLMAGSVLAKRLVTRLDPSDFRLIIDALMLAVGAMMLSGLAG